MGTINFSFLKEKSHADRCLRCSCRFTAWSRRKPWTTTLAPFRWSPFNSIIKHTYIQSHLGESPWKESLAQAISRRHQMKYKLIINYRLKAE